MALYRCASCGSPNVITDQENDGIKYDYVKGAIGTVELGAGGAVAGLSNKSKLVFKCRDCGVSLGYPLGEPYKTLIDTGVASMAGRQTLNINGFPISWDTIKSKFPNIESGLADAEIQTREDTRRQNKADAVEYLMTLWQRDNADDMVFLQKSETELDVAQAEWESNKKNLEIQKKEHLQNSIAEIENQLQQLESRKNTELTEIQEKIDAVEVEIKKLQEQFSVLGVFKLSEKANLKKQIAEKMEFVDDLKGKISKKESKYNDDIKEQQRNLENIRGEMTKKLDIIYAPAESPKDRFARLQEEQKALKQGRFPIDSPRVYILRYYPHLLSYYGKASDDEIQDIFEAFLLEMTKLPSVYVTHQRIASTRRYYSPFITGTMEGYVTDSGGLITKMGTMYYEYNGI